MGSIGTGTWLDKLEEQCAFMRPYRICPLADKTQ